MKTSKFLLTSLALAGLLLASASGLHAQATGTWVSGVGDDANPCSRTAPGKTFAGAISKTAAGGEIRVLDPGGFGAVTITKSMTITGDGTLASILATGSNAIIINAGPTDVVVLRNLIIKSPGGGIAPPSGLFGIKILQAGAVHVENCVIDGGTDLGISFTPANAGAQLIVTNTLIDNCQGGGIRATPASTALITINNSNIKQCKFGVRTDQGSKMTVNNSVITGNTLAGAVASGSGELNLIGSTVSFNGTGVNAGVTGSGSIARLSNSSILNNTGTGIQASNGSSQVISSGNNTVSGNTPNGTPTSTVPQI